MHWRCGKDDLASEGTLVWATFHVIQQSATESLLCALLPYLYEKSTTPAMIKRYTEGGYTEVSKWMA